MVIHSYTSFMITRALTSHYLPTGYDKADGHAYGTPMLLSLTESNRHVESMVTSTLSHLNDTLVGKPIISKATGITTVTVPYYTSTPFNPNVVNGLGLQLSHSLGCLVELRLIHLEAPYLDATILSQWLSAELVDSTFQQAIGLLMTLVGPTTDDSPVGSIIGIKVQLAGRLMTEASLPRAVVQSSSLGSFKLMTHQSLQSGSYTVSNLKGAYTVKVWLSVKA